MSERKGRRKPTADQLKLRGEFAEAVAMRNHALNSIRSCESAIRRLGGRYDLLKAEKTELTFVESVLPDHRRELKEAIAEIRRIEAIQSKNGI